jgi:hypothetical protein
MARRPRGDRRFLHNKNMPVDKVSVRTSRPKNWLGSFMPTFCILSLKRGR